VGAAGLPDARTRLTATASPAASVSGKRGVLAGSRRRDTTCEELEPVAEVYGGRELRRSIRQRGMGYVMAVRANHVVSIGSGRTVTAARAAGMIPHQAWHRMRTGSGTKGTRHHDWAMLEVTSDDTPG
jgi:hypothetical protein